MASRTASQSSLMMSAERAAENPLCTKSSTRADTNASASATITDSAPNTNAAPPKMATFIASSACPIPIPR